MHLFSTLLPLLTLAISANAHTIFQELYVNGVSAGHMEGIRVPDYNGPIENVNSNDIICNGGINPYRQPISKKVIDVPAGATVTARWQHTLFNGHIIDDSHKGPILTYLAKVNDATSLEVTGLRWFKIAEEGWDPVSNVWAVDRLIANNGRWDIRIPNCIAPGEYLLRHELIALHSAGSYPGAQFYMECAQIRITGTGGNAQPATVSFPGAYSGTDPGIRVGIWYGLTSYTIPGPRPFVCPGGSSTTQPPTTQPPTTQPPTTQPPTTQPPTTQPSTTQPPTTQPPTTQPPTTTPPTGGAAQWAQCGGNGFTGPTTCVSPYRCVVLNDWYHQCQ